MAKANIAVLIRERITGIEKIELKSSSSSTRRRGFFIKIKLSVFDVENAVEYLK